MQKTHRILLLLNAGRQFSRGLLRGIAKYTSLHDPWICYRQPHNYLKPAYKIDIEEIKRWQPDGGFCPAENLDILSDLNIPIITYNLNSHYSGQIPVIISEDHQAGNLAARYLIDIGHHSFAFCGYDNMGWSQDRCQGFCKSISQSGWEVNKYSQKEHLNFSSESENKKIEKWLKSLPKPVGLFCANDDLAELLMEKCRLLKFSVPEEISIIGADDDWHICELQNPGLSSVHIDSVQAGYEAAGLMERLISGKEKIAGQRIIASAKIVTQRQSTNAILVKNQEIRKALTFIRENCQRQLSVSEVVEATNLSHRALNYQFHEECGCSIIKHISRARINYISKLLIETDMRVHEIAQRAGYRDERHISRYFKRATGMVPSDFRRQFK